MKLRDVGACNQFVDIALHSTQPRKVHGHSRRDDRVMRRDLCIVPRARFLLCIRFARPCTERRAIQRRQIAENLRRVLVLIHGQILRIRARIARQLLLVQLLRCVEHLLRLIAVALAREHLQRREGKRERRRLLLLLALIARDLRVLRIAAKRL